MKYRNSKTPEESLPIPSLPASYGASRFPTGQAIFLIFVVLSFLRLGCSSLAYVASSTNYRIQSDSINIGGARQTSTSYISEDTIGEIATGDSTSTSYGLKAGYQQMQETYIAISVSPDEIAMSPDIGGITGGQSNGSTTANVITDSASGYSLSVRSSASPALATSSYSFADYTPASAETPDYIWLILSTTSEFGFTPYGSDTVTKYRYIGTACNQSGGAADADTCWYGFSTSNETIASSYSSNHPTGTQTTVELKAESGTQHVQEQGIYEAAITSTALTN